MKTNTLILVAIALFSFFSCKKEQPSLPKSSFKQVYEFTILEPSLNLEIYCGNGISYPGRVSGMVCPADYDSAPNSIYLVSAAISDKSTISPSDSSWVDFSSPKQFTVTAEDGSDTTFWVTVGTVEGQWLKDGTIVDEIKFDLTGTIGWDFKSSELTTNAFEFTIGRQTSDWISGLVYDWNYQDFTNLPKTVPFQPLVKSQIAGFGFNGGGQYCTDCTLTITELDLERGVFSGNWNLSFSGDVINGSVGSFKNAPLYGEF